MLEALRAVLKDPEATTEQRLYAVAVLDSMESYHFIPYSMKNPGAGKSSGEIVADFAKRLEAHQEKGK